MESKCCSSCADTRILSCFLKNASADPSSKVFATCIPCRDKAKKRRALQTSHPDRPSKRRVEPSTTTQAIELSRPPPLCRLQPRLIRPAQSQPILAIQRLIQPQPRNPQPNPPVQHHAQAQGPMLPFQSRARRQQTLQSLEPRAPQRILAVQRQVQRRPISSVLPRVQPQIRRQQPPPPLQRRPLLPVQPQPFLPLQHPVLPIQHQVLPKPLQPLQRQALPIQPAQPQVQPRPILPVQPQVTGFLPAEQWGYIQRFNTAMGEVKMDTCLRCKERWFAMDLGWSAMPASYEISETKALF